MADEINVEENPVPEIPNILPAEDPFPPQVPQISERDVKDAVATFMLGHAQQCTQGLNAMRKMMGANGFEILDDPTKAYIVQARDHIQKSLRFSLAAIANISE